MKPAISIAVLAAISGVVVADSCTPGLNYCGSTLLRKGNYQGQIDQNYWDTYGDNGDYGYEAPNNGNNLLYSCIGGRSGVITLIEVCPLRCTDNGQGWDDTCSLD